jgi:hypothetical protein
MMLKMFARGTLLVGPAAVGALLVLWATALGPGTEGDSSTYVCATQSFIARGALCDCGTTWPMIHFPPLYPVLLAIASLFGAAPLTAARWVGAISCAASVIVTGALLCAATSSIFVALLGELLFICGVTTVFLFAMSEAPFIVFLLLFVLALWRALQDEGLGWIVIAGGAAAAACLTRYMGASLLVTGASGLVCLGVGPIAARVRRSAVFLTIGGTPLTIWLIRNHLETGNFGRSLAWHPPSSADLLLACSTVAHWVFPWVSKQTAQWIGLPLLIGSVVVLVIVEWRNPYPLAWLLANLILCNGALILLCRFVNDRAILLNQRMLTPILVSSLVLTLSAIDFTATRLSVGMRWRAIGFALGLLFVFLSARATAPILYQSRVNGLGFTERYYAGSALISWIRNLPAGTAIYSDEPEPISMFTNHFAKSLPVLRDPYTRQPSRGFERERAAMESSMSQLPGVIVYFYKANPHSTENLPPLEAMPFIYHLSMKTVLETQQGVIYEARAAAITIPARN